jgi:heptosyltransferase I
MGDVIHAIPVAEAIHTAWPDTRITWIIDPRWEPLLRGNPAVAALHRFPREEFRGTAGMLRAVAWYAGLRHLAPDICLDLQGLLRSGLMALCSRARRTHGLSDAREGARLFHHTRIPTVAGEHAVRRYLRALPSLGLPEPDAPSWTLPQGSNPQGFDPMEPYTLIHPFARGQGKSMGPEAVARFIETHLARSTRRLVVAGKGPPLATTHPRVIDLLGGTTLDELIGLLRGAAFVVSVDSGPMHLAAALHRPLLSIHTWTDPRLVGPFTEGAFIWQGGSIRRREPDEQPLKERDFTTDDADAVAAFAAQR